ncbi:hypothetical protein DFH09DRAFT_1314815 [Mycena vulgaris]|nr:hypothetical protein DFH09DRAFT_1314815 [Mycena vulgaris]
MLQLAAHPYSVTRARDTATTATPPRALARPVRSPSRARSRARPSPTSCDALLAAAPELAGVLTELIRYGRRLGRKRPAMLAGIAALASSHLPAPLPWAHLPAALIVPCACKGGGGEREAAHAIFPVHAVVLAAYCTMLPRLPPSAPVGSSRTLRAKLSVLPLTLPSPHAFAVLHAFMYTHRLAPALAFLSSSSSRFSSHGEEPTHQALPATSLS